MNRKSLPFATRREATGITTGYLSQLDGLRGLSVIAVVFTHSMHSAVTQWFRPGIGGVRLFFVISGFLITGILLDARRRSETSNRRSDSDRGQILFAFYARRVLRIFPIYYLFIGIGCLLGNAEIREYFIWHAAYLSNILTAIRGEFAASTAHLWSLAVEEQFYVIWPFVVLGVPALRLPYVLWGMVIAAPCVRLIALSCMNSVASGVLMPACMDSLAAGALVAYYQRYPSEFAALWLGSRWMLVLAATLTSALCLAIAFSTAYRLRHAFLDTGFSMLFASLVMQASHGLSGWPGRLLEFRPLRFVGRISYGIYLYHLAVIEVVCMSLGISLGFVNFFTSLLVTIALASCSWLVIEQPLNRQKSRFPYLASSPGAGP